MNLHEFLRKIPKAEFTRSFNRNGFPENSSETVPKTFSQSAAS